jgi:hypothetical protein
MKYRGVHTEVNNTASQLLTQIPAADMLDLLGVRISSGAALLGTISLSAIFRGLTSNRELNKAALRSVLCESAALCLLEISNVYHESYNRDYCFGNDQEIEFILNEMKGKEATSIMLALQTCSVGALIDAKASAKDSEFWVRDICMSGLLVSLMCSIIVLDQHFEEI